jgi:phosphoadenosine phosphosulfate reductase
VSAELTSPATVAPGRSPEEVLAWAAERFPRIALATAFGPEGCALIDMIGRRQLPIRMITVDTGLFFPETIDLWKKLEQRYGVTIEAIRPRHSVEEQAREYGERLWERDPDRCCELRKVQPLTEALAGLDAWITSVRRDQTLQRASAEVVEVDRRFGLIKVNPLVEWTSDQVWDYLRKHDVPVNPLHALGYPSIGCTPCTSRVGAGEDPRAGRWRGTSKTECGLHVGPRETRIVLERRRPRA